MSRSVRRVGATTLVVCLLWIGVQLLIEGRPIDLMYPGELSAAAPLVEERFGPDVLVEDSTGYDGTAFWAIATEFPDLDGAAPYVAEPRYRFQRILTPAVASLGGDGDGAALLILLAGALGTAAGAAALADVAVRHGRPAWTGYLFFFPLVFAVAWGTSEPAAFGAAMVGIALADRGRLGWAAAAFVVGALAREPVALMAVAVAGGLFVARRQPLRALWPLALPGVVVVGWMAFLAAQYPAAPNPDRLDPFGVVDAGPTGVLLGLLVLVAGGVAAWTWRDVPAVWPVGLLFVALTLTYGDALFRFQVVYRASAPVLALALAGLLTGRERRPEGGADVGAPVTTPLEAPG
jgi:hypothetical protein